jgi:hypothetical protein
MRRTLLTVFTVAVFIPLSAHAQDTELPRGMFVSQWQCPQAELATIAQVYDSIIRPIEQELVDEGSFFGGGMVLSPVGRRVERQLVSPCPGSRRRL